MIIMGVTKKRSEREKVKQRIFFYRHLLKCSNLLQMI